MARELSSRGIAYLHLIEPDAIPEPQKQLPALRKLFAGRLILAGEFDRDSAAAAIADGRADYVAFGRLYIANPDLAERFRLGAELNIPNPATFYSGGDAGYIDYPALDEEAGKVADGPS